jgi:hypothetical protein
MPIAVSTYYALKARGPVGDAAWAGRGDPP